MNNKETAGFINYYTMLDQYQQAQLFLAGLRLDIFSYLDSWISTDEIAIKMEVNAEKLAYILLGLTAIKLIDKEGVYYRNTKEGSKYLSKASMNYLGETILFREEMTSLDRIEEQMDETNERSHSYDFAKLARVVVPEIYATGRVEDFLREIARIYPSNYDAELRVLDLGGGSGILAMEFAKQYPNSIVTVYESAEVAKVCKEILVEKNAPSNVNVVEGDFIHDALGGPYDLIIASGILDFATDNLFSFMMKVKEAMCEEGDLLLIGQHDKVGNVPHPRIISWLSGYIHGLPYPSNIDEINEAIQAAGLICIGAVDSGRFKGKRYRKERA